MTRRDRREQERARRARRPAEQRSPAGGSRRSLYTAVAVVVVVIALIAGGRALGIFGPAAAPADPLLASKYDVAGETIGTHEADESNAHVPVGQKVTYKTDPPTSGSHWDQQGVAPVAWGIKDATQPNEAIVHNLEHGGVVVFYSGLSADDLSKLSGLVRELAQNGYPKMVLEPYPLKDAGIHIALSAWRWSLKLPAYDDAQIVKFVKAHYEGPDAPEPQTM